jgi:hypothetical protein
MIPCLNPHSITSSDEIIKSGKAPAHGIFFYFDYERQNCIRVRSDTQKKFIVVTGIKKCLISQKWFIFQMHNPGEPLTPVSAWDRACIVRDGFCKYCRCCYREDVGIQKESRPDQCQDQTSTLLPDNTLNFSSRGCCAGVLSIDNMPRIFYIPWFFSDQINVIKNN